MLILKNFLLIGLLVASVFSACRKPVERSGPPPDLPVNEGAYYSSLYLKDNNTLVLITTRNFADGHSEVWWKEGRINR